MWRRAQIIYLCLMLAYAVMGLLIVSIAYAQNNESSASPIFPVPAETTVHPPSGSSDAVVDRYYRYLDIQNYAHLTETYHLDVRGLLEFYGVAAMVIFILYFFVFIWYVRRKVDDLYPAEVYNGYISERGGPIDAFNWWSWAVMTVYAIAYIAVTMVYGQLY